MKWVYETGIERPEILGSGSNYSNVVTSTDFETVLAESRKGSRNYLIRRRYADGCLYKEDYDFATETWRPR